ncbi:hypothetical protein LSAT2_013908, partial [Lamellibrachia satsuma]
VFGNGLTVDTVTGKIYFTNKATVEVVNTDGTERATVIEHFSGARTYGVAVEISRRLLFHTTQYPAGVFKSRLDGTAAVEIVSADLQSPWGVAIDYNHQQICWADSDEKAVKCSDYEGSNPRLEYSTTGSVRYIDIEDETLYYAQDNPNSVYSCRLDWASCRVLNVGAGRKTGIAVWRDKDKVFGATPHLTATPAVKKELLMRLNDADNATCLDLAHTDHYTFETSSSGWFPEPQHDCWIPGLVIKACLPNKGKTPVTIKITGHRLVCSASHFRVLVKQHALPDCVVAGKYDLCELSGPTEPDPEGLTTCAATCVCEGNDCRHVTIQIPKKYEDWEICEISIE